MTADNRDGRYGEGRPVLGDGEGPRHVLTECATGSWRMRYEITSSLGDKTGNANDVSDTLRVRSIEECRSAR